MDGVYLLVGFKHSTAVICTLGRELTPLSESGRRPVGTSMAKVIDLFLYALHTLWEKEQNPANRYTVSV